MARKAKEILLARGYTEAELATMATLLADAKFCTAIEAEAAEADTHRASAEKLQKDLEDDTSWYHKVAVPAMEKARNEAIEAREKAAGLEARMKAQQDYGLARVAAGQEPANPANPNPPANPATQANPALDSSRFVDIDTFKGAFDSVGDAIQFGIDAADEYRELFGKRLPGGVDALRKEFKIAREQNRFRGNLYEFADQKFGFAAKRTELTAAETKRREDALREEGAASERAKMGTPFTRPMSASRNPFTNRVSPGGSPVPGEPNAKPTQPWEKSDVERSEARISKVVKKAATIQ